MGYTDDGKVFMVVNGMVEEVPAQMIVTLTPEQAISVHTALTEAINKVVGDVNERNSKYPH